MGRQVVEHDHVAGHQRRAEHLLEVGGKHVAVDGPAHGHGRYQRHVRPAVQGRGLVGTLPAFGAGIAAAVGQVGTGLVHELDTGEIFALHRFEKGRHTGAALLVLGSEGDQTLKEIALGHVSTSVYGYDTLGRYGPLLLQA